MLWFFLAGMISGAVGTVMYANYWIRKHAQVIKLPPLNEEEKTDEGVGTDEK